MADAEEPPERVRRILDFERRDWRDRGVKAGAIAAAFGLSPTRYYQILNAAIDTPAALRYDPILVGRLLRARETRLASRRLGLSPADDAAGSGPIPES
ncbi:MAG: DUF3263 domain-containing protein [Microbacteriaceae bacterium]